MNKFFFDICMYLTYHSGYYSYYILSCGIYMCISGIGSQWVYHDLKVQKDPNYIIGQFLAFQCPSLQYFSGHIDTNVT